MFWLLERTTGRLIAYTHLLRHQLEAERAPTSAAPPERELRADRAQLIAIDPDEAVRRQIRDPHHGVLEPVVERDDLSGEPEAGPEGDARLGRLQPLRVERGADARFAATFVAM
jgi:hypothetical protein